MPFEWMEGILRSRRKADDYAEKTLAAYRLGMRAGGSIRGVSISAGDGCCVAAQVLPPGEVYHPDQAPRLPLPGCTLGAACPCLYRPVMDYPGEKA